jgi:hypothetical protein
MLIVFQPEVVPQATAPAPGNVVRSYERFVLQEQEQRYWNVGSASRRTKVPYAMMGALYPANLSLTSNSDHHKLNKLAYVQRQPAPICRAAFNCATVLVLFNTPYSSHT